jgi:nucleotidyltransferase substrate binding protein (TIGR01987 family)
MTLPTARWLQRLQNFKMASEQLSLFLVREQLNPLEEQGLIQCFEYNYELAWNTIKDFYEAQGEFGLQGSRDAFRLGIKRGLLEDAQLWMDMIGARARTSHTYDLKMASAVVKEIQTAYAPAFQKLIQSLESQKP